MTWQRSDCERSMNSVCPGDGVGRCSLYSKMDESFKILMGDFSGYESNWKEVARPWPFTGLTAGECPHPGYDWMIQKVLKIPERKEPEGGKCYAPCPEGTSRRCSGWQRRACCLSLPPSLSLSLSLSLLLSLSLSLSLTLSLAQGSSGSVCQCYPTPPTGAYWTSGTATVQSCGADLFAAGEKESTHTHIVLYTPLALDGVWMIQSRALNGTCRHCGKRVQLRQS